jgi:hypothetical protein
MRDQVSAARCLDIAGSRTQNDRPTIFRHDGLSESWTMKTYELTTLNDVINKVPADRIRLCFDELATAFIAIAAMRDAMQISADALGLGDISSAINLPESHTWMDDGLGNVSVHCHDGDGAELFGIDINAGESQ